MLSDPNMTLEEFTELRGLELTPAQCEIIRHVEQGNRLVVDMAAKRQEPDFCRQLQGGFLMKDTLTGEVRERPVDEREWISDAWTPRT